MRYKALKSETVKGRVKVTQISKLYISQLKVKRSNLMVRLNSLAALYRHNILLKIFCSQTDGHTNERKLKIK